MVQMAVETFREYRQDRIKRLFMESQQESDLRSRQAEVVLRESLKARLVEVETSFIEANAERLALLAENKRLKTKLRGLTGILVGIGLAVIILLLLI